ncbi:MAG: hypothetical protein E7530_03835 [Ruminococcaceae bacterium]|nr:hypothetical protein [Oscillospiraceae bacterium]
MEYKRTDDLLEQLKLQNISYEDYLSENEDSFVVKDLTAFWKKTIKKSKMAKIDIINGADMGYTYFYNIIGGKSIPARDTIVKIYISMGLDIDDCQTALKLYNWAYLYPKNKRDSILIYALTHKLSLYEVEDMLVSQGEKGLKTI